MNKSRELDQFYTNPKVAKICYDFLTQLIKKDSFFIEPSAGSGSFYSILPKFARIGLDIDPKHDEILTCDFFKFNIDKYNVPKNLSIVTIGNPPFGKNSSLALKFLNKAAKFSNFIAFILPKTFKKDSVINKIDPHLRLVGELKLPKNSFIFNDEEYDVPCVFQVWEKTTILREKIDKPLNHSDFIFSNKDDADFAIRRVGVLAGKVILDFKKFSPASHYYIKTIADTKEVLSKMQSINWENVKNNTAGNPSISKRELIQLYSI